MTVRKTTLSLIRPKPMALTQIIDINVLTKQSFEELFRTYFKQLSYFAFGFVKDQDTAKEIVHDVFINLWNKRDTIDLNKSVKSYLYTSVHNRCLNSIRDNRKFNHMVEIESASEHYHSDSDNLVAEEIQEKINKTLDSLPEKCREIFYLSRFEELRYNEIAERLSISVKTVEAQMSKALKIFRDSLREYMITLLVLIINAFL